jgi:predicted DNA binding CopG/RHH family protein
MRKHYDFSTGLPNPYAKQLKRQVTIRLDEPTLVYFKALAEETAIPYQTLINLYLRECAASQKHLRLAWLSGAKSAKRAQP